MPTNPRKRRRVRRRIRRVVVTLSIVVTLGVMLVVVPAGASDSTYHADANASIADVQAYWSATLPTISARRYRPIPQDRVYPYSRANPPPGCGTPGRTPYAEVAGNAFYCEEGNFIAYDAEALVPRMRGSYGEFAVGLVLAHELGHAVQGQVGFPSDQSIYVELQADCFAGAWAGHVASGSGTSLRFSVTDLDRALAGFLQLRDPSGVDGRQDGAHGNAFDRVGAFQDGLEGGARACRSYGRTPPQVTEAGYTSFADRQVNGDPPLAEALPVLRESLGAYWARTAEAYGPDPKVVATDGTPACARGSDGGVLSATVVYCAPTNTITYATRTLDDAERRIGDLGAGVYVAAAWSSAVEHAIGVPLRTAAARTIAECLTGAWAGAVQDGGRTPNAAAFSPGDLDEIVATFVATGSGARALDGLSVFQRVQRFRTGFVGGPSACLDT